MNRKPILLSGLALLLLVLAACMPSQPGPPLAITVPPPPPSLTTTASLVPASPSPAPTASPTPAPAPTASPTPGPLVFAAIGDYGLRGPDEAAVADLVKSWDPAFIITLGDNNYPDGAADTIDDNIGQFYSDFLYPYTGAYGPGATENRFFPSPGNHDWGADGLQPYLDYFSLPGNERYYDFVWGPVHLFALDSDTREPDGVGLSSLQAQWLQAALAGSSSPWKIVYMHHPPYSSARHGSTDYMQWPFAEWGADAVLAGHDHTYERLIVDDIPYIVNGLGGYPARYFFFTALEGSQFQYRDGYGALRITATEETLTFEMIGVDGVLLDSQTLTAIVAAPAPESVTALPDPAAYEWLPFASGFDRPVLLTHAGDGSGRLFVVEQTGRIRIIGQSEPFLSITDRLTSQGFEQGLLGLAFDPDFAANGFLYVNYTDRSGDTVISRFQVHPDTPDQPDPDSEAVLLRIDQPFGNHNGGHLAFGPDGLLYAGMGDGGSAGDPQNHAQNPVSLLGKLLRIDPDAGTAEIFASGLRNPWRFSFDRLTGDLYIGDVGQGQWEEISFLPAGTPPGANFGWKFFEGSHPYEGAPPDGTALIPPVAEYSHAVGGCSVTGGPVYRGLELPAFYGVYLFSDYCSGLVWGLVRDAGGDWQFDALFFTQANVSSFGEDEAGEVYLVAHNGSIFKLTAR